MRDKKVGKFQRNRNNLAFRGKDWLLCQKTDIKEVKKHRNLILHIIPECIHTYTTYILIMTEMHHIHLTEKVLAISFAKNWP